MSDSGSGDWLSASRANTRLRASASESSLHEVFSPALGRDDSTCRFPSLDFTEFSSFLSRDKSTVGAEVWPLLVALRVLDGDEFS